MSHVGRERMEASSWRPSYGPHRPLLRSEPMLRTALWWAALGALLVAFVICWAALLEMNRTYPPVIETNAGFTWTAIHPDTGRVIPRAEWIEGALIP